jgi:predicted alpha-1,6-mannanase (GH76 family)
MQASTQPDTSPAALQGLYDGIKARYFADLEAPTPEEFRAGIDEVTADLELEAEAG